MNKHLRIVIAVGIWAVCTACNGCLGIKSPVDRPGGTLGAACDEMQPTLEPQQLDILFVIDNSGSMKEEQEGVARELTAFVNELRMSGGVAQNIRVGVITTAVYENVRTASGTAYYRACEPPRTSQFCTQSGKLQPVPDANGDGGVLLGTGSQRVIDYDDPDLIAKFARLVQQGTNGSGQETPFEALRLALFDLQGTPLAQGGNGGFLRDGARLLIVTLTDEDDCSEAVRRPPTVVVGDQPNIDYCGDQGNSLTPVTEYFDTFNGLKDSKGDKKEIIYTVIGPVAANGGKAAMLVRDPVAPFQVRNIDCPTSVEPGFRHRAMAEMFYTDLSNLDSICKPSYKDTLIAIANLAGVSQSIEIQGVPDPGVLQLIIKRKDGTLQTCTLDNGGFTWEDDPKDDQPGRAFFGANCKRSRDDLELKIDRLCIY